MKFQETPYLIHFKHKCQLLDQQKYSYRLRTSIIVKGIYGTNIFIIHAVTLLSSCLENTIQTTLFIPTLDTTTKFVIMTVTTSSLKR